METRCRIQQCWKHHQGHFDDCWDTFDEHRIKAAGFSGGRPDAFPSAWNFSGACLKSRDDGVDFPEKHDYRKRTSTELTASLW